MGTKEERQLLLQISRGDHLAFRVFFDRFYPQVLGFLISFLHSEEDASDLSQEVFIKIWNMRAILPEIRKISCFLYRMTINSAINYTRNKKKYADIFSLEVPFDNAIEDQIDIKEKESKLVAAILEMPVQRRRIFLLSRFELVPNGQIAQMLGISRKTVENHLNLALKGLRISGIFQDPV